ncbi:MAG: hypothetical protein N4A68_14330 [Maledivibacter sp.]|jgi:hypothetical protein|nr:hypothetical protein [Maledivibacter sp.]
MENQKFQVLLIGVILTITGMICKKVPVNFLKGYEYIKNDQKALKRTKIFHLILGYIFQISGMFIIVIGILNILSNV